MPAPRRARRVVVTTDGAPANVSASNDAPAPAQERFHSGVDHRGITLTSRGGSKRKRDDADAPDDANADAMMVDESFREYKAPKRTFDAVPGRKSGRLWKQPASRASALGRVASSKSWEERMREKAAKKRFVEAKLEAKAERGAKIRAERERREAKKAQREENRLRTGLGQKQEISNPKTIAKKSAKERAKLKKLRML